MALSVLLPIAATLTQTSTLDIASGSAPIAFLANYVFSTGTSAYQGTTFTSDQRTLAALAIDSFDLAGGLVDIFGNVVTFTRIRAILIESDAAAAGDLIIFDAVANPFRGPMSDVATSMTLGAGDVFVCVAPDPDGWPVIAGTGDIFNILNNSGGNITYNIVLIGTT